MKKFLSLFILLLFCLTSCSRVAPYTPKEGSYEIICKISDAEYKINVEISPDLYGKMTFPEGTNLSNCRFTCDTDGQNIKFFDSFGEKPSESQKVCAKYIFALIYAKLGNVSHVSHEKISSVDVSVLSDTDGGRLYVNSKTGEGIRVTYRGMTADIISGQ